MSNGHPIDHANGQAPGMSVTERAELERLAAEATPGPWTAEWGDVSGPEPKYETVVGLEESAYGYLVSQELVLKPADAAFIAAARSAVPALLSALSAAEARVRELEAEVMAPCDCPAHLERKRTAAAEAALASSESREREAREALREIVGCFSFNLSGEPWMPLGATYSLSLPAALARARRVLSTVEGNSRLVAHPETQS